MIFNIQRYSTHDGPGIRTVIFFKGCSLSCHWCQNPESESRHQEILFDQRFCIQDCHLCSSCFPNIFTKSDNHLLINRGVISSADYQALTNLCPSKALNVCGQEMSIDEIMQAVKKDEAFYQRSGGGITLSGGEPFMQPHLAMKLLQKCRQNGYHTAVETCLHTPWKHISPSLPYLNLMLVDLKHVDEKRFLHWTGGSAKRVLDNYRHLSIESNVEMIVRVPLIPNFNADKQSITDIVDFVSHETHAKEIHFLPYHTLGANKYTMLDKEYLAPDKPLNDDALLDFAVQYAQQQHLTPILRG
ncbi:pyruvate formate lyase-activating protein [Chelonobacter oris]|uniref:Pyruvate formate lyase-activating protein n=1 Tax=Chelonobacter oris TaxID=505317 RepID=A0A0A3B718_9PAST|nr:glycyl-radical enzyme activating protein [Chelonobacter oris]KGQ69399.1 pyruvate formate lyase-activating protein [Chelonobacter oris]MDH2999732.1 pyruvate formate lyase-activating protein [Chelonobacter oris]